MSIKLLDLPYHAEAIFRKRPNRFIGIVDIINTSSGKVTSKSVKTHVHDPGRLEEILYPGNRVLLKKPDIKTIETRKTKWDILAGRVNDQWVLVNSGFHRQLVEEILKNKKINPFGKLSNIQPEVKFGKSRLDFLLTEKNGKQVFLEVKGCTLTIDERALFPDAPSLRASRHLEELIQALENGYKAGVIILVFRVDSKCFAPNGQTDPKFESTFKKALNLGVMCYPMVLSFHDGCIYFEKTIPVCHEYL